MQFRPEASAAHLDVTPAGRALAVGMGARQVTSLELARLNYDGRTRRGLRGPRERERAEADARALDSEGP